jgi:hypothetical protein
MEAAAAPVGRPAPKEAIMQSPARWWIAVVLMLVGLAAPPSAPAQAPGTLVVGLVAEPVNLDPAQVTDLNSLQ